MKTAAITGAAFLALSCLCSGSTLCGVGTLSSYAALGSGGCTIGGDKFFDFQVLNGTAGAIEIAGSQVVLAPSGSAGAPTLSTEVNVSSPAGAVLESIFTYEVTGTTYTGALLTLSHSSQTGDGAVTGLENFCAGGVFGPDGVDGCTGTPGALATINSTQNQDSSSFAGVTLLSVTNDLTMDGGQAGSAKGGTLADQFTAVPEPVTIVLTGMGLLLYAGCRRYKFRDAGVAGRPVEE